MQTKAFKILKNVCWDFPAGPVAKTPRTGTTQRDDMGREEGGGFRMGNTCIPVAGSF